MTPDQCTVGVILAGGRATRMGERDKPLLSLAGEPILGHIIRQAAPQVSRLLLSVNRRPERYQNFQLPIIADREHAGSGPLAGIHSAMLWAEENYPQAGYLACFPADVPWFPPTLVQDLHARIEQSGSAMAWSKSDGQIQPLFSLWSIALREALSHALDEGLYGPKLVIPTLASVCLEYSAQPPGCFFNINTPDDLETAHGLIKNRQKKI